MHVTIRKYAGKGALIDKLVPPVRDGLVPLLKSAPGFKGYCAFASEDGHVVSVTVFDDRGAATRANEQVRGWVVSNLGELLPNLPEVLAGECKVHETAAPRQQGQGASQTAMHCVFRVTEGAPPQAQVLPGIKEHLLPALRRQPGFRGLYGARSDGDASRLLQVSLWDSAEAAEEGLRTMAEINATRMGGAFPEPTTVLSGRTVVAATA